MLNVKKHYLVRIYFLADTGAGFSGNGKGLPFKKYLSLDLFWNQPFEENYNIIAYNTNINSKHYSSFLLSHVIWLSSWKIQPWDQSLNYIVEDTF